MNTTSATRTTTRTRTTTTTTKGTTSVSHHANNKRKTIPVTLSWDELKERLALLSEDDHDNDENKDPISIIGSNNAVSKSYSMEVIQSTSLGGT